MPQGEKQTLLDHRATHRRSGARVIFEDKTLAKRWPVYVPAGSRRRVFHSGNKPVRELRSAQTFLGWNGLVWPERASLHGCVSPRSPVLAMPNGRGFLFYAN